MKSMAAIKLCVCLGLFVFAVTLPRAESVAWVVGQQTEGHVSPFIGRYDQWLVGNPRNVAYTSGFSLSYSLGGICGGSWVPDSRDESTQYDFNCIATAEEITANTGNVGFYVGGLNANGVTIALCYVTTLSAELCDTDTITEHGALACISYLKCE